MEHHKDAVQRRVRLPKRLRDVNGVTTARNTALNSLGAIADSGFKTGQRILWICCRSLYGQSSKSQKMLMGATTAYTTVTPTFLSGLISGELMVRHGLGLPGNDRQIVSVDIGESS